MSRDLLWIGILCLIYAIIKLRPDLFHRLVVAVAGNAIGKAALASQPDAITLNPASGPPARPEARSAVESLQRRGFVAAGSFTVPEMKNLPLHFLVKEDEAAIAVVYEHPQAGVFCDICCRYQDGTSFTVTNARMGGGLDEHPGRTKVRAPGLTPAALHLRFTRERPTAPMIATPADEVAQFFADAYTDEMAWRKQKGLSRSEVKAAAFERKTA